MRTPSFSYIYNTRSSIGAYHIDKISEEELSGIRKRSSGSYK